MANFVPQREKFYKEKNRTLKTTMGLGVEQKEGCTRISIDSLIPQKCRATQCPMACGVRGGCLS